MSIVKLVILVVIEMVFVLCWGYYQVSLLALPAGLEPATYELTVRCSTN